MVVLVLINILKICFKIHKIWNHTNLHILTADKFVSVYMCPLVLMSDIALAIMSMYERIIEEFGKVTMP